MQCTYLDLEQKYLGKENLEELCLAKQVEILEKKSEGYARLRISPALTSEERELLLEELLFKESRGWCLANYMKPYRSLLESDYYKQMEEEVLKLYSREESLLKRTLRQDLPRLEINSQFNINGYLCFQAKEWQRLIQNFLAEIYMQIADEIEQEEFIALLQYFVRSQPIILDKVYLFLAKDGSFFLKDEYGHNLRTEYLEQVSNEELESVSEVDLLLSILVTLLPRKIYLHSEEDENFPPLKLLKQVFGERIISW